MARRRITRMFVLTDSDSFSPWKRKTTAAFGLPGFLRKAAESRTRGVLSWVSGGERRAGSVFFSYQCTVLDLPSCYCAKPCGLILTENCGRCESYFQEIQAEHGLDLFCRQCEPSIRKIMLP